MEIIRKNFNFKIKEKMEDGGYKIAGYISTFDKDLDNDRILPASIININDDIKLLKDHDKFSVDSIIGKFVDIKQDNKGYYGTAILSATNYNKTEVIPKIKDGSLDSFSIGFNANDYVKNNFGGLDFKSIELKEVSLVSYPANRGAKINEKKEGVKLDNLEIIKELQTEIKSLQENQNNTKEVQKEVNELNAKIAELQTLQANANKALKNNDSENTKAFYNIALNSNASNIASKDKSSLVTSYDNGSGVGLFVPDTVSAEMFKEVFKTDSNLLSYCSTMPVGGKNLVFYGTNKLMHATRRGEALPSTKDGVQYSERRIEMHGISVGYEYTQESMDWQNTVTQNSFLNDFADSKRNRYTWEVINGSGVGEFKGVLSYDNLSTYETQTANTLNLKDLQNVAYTTVKGGNNRQFVMSLSTLGMLMHETASDGHYKLAFGYNNQGMVISLFGKPVIIVDTVEIAQRDALYSNTDAIVSDKEILPSPSASGAFENGATPVLFGDFAHYKIGEQSKQTMIIDPYTRAHENITRVHNHTHSGGGLIMPSNFTKIIIKSA